MVESRDKSTKSQTSAQIDPTAILIYGGGGHGKQVLELISVSGNYKIAGFIDDGISPGSEILGVLVLGGSTLLPDLYDSGVRFAVNAVGGIGNISIRLKVFHTLVSEGFECPTLVHPTAYIEPSAKLEKGVQVFAHAYVGSDAVIGFGSIVNTGAIVSHDCRIGEYVNVSPGAILAGQVTIDNNVLVGMGATINLNVHVGSNSRIGNNATVKTDVPDNSIVHAGCVWPP
jgi:sugar O-acyltransferase (sialic acid O-acetyltransferase NeuD family)